jgi:toxin ParE1/3/4
MGYSLSIKAEEDIVHIFRTGMEQFGLYQANRYHQRLKQCFQFLADNPLAARERVEITPPVRIHPVEAHLAVYRVEDDGNIFIIRVRHGREDWQASADIEPSG